MKENRRGQTDQPHVGPDIEHRTRMRMAPCEAGQKAREIGLVTAVEECEPLKPAPEVELDLVFDWASKQRTDPGMRSRQSCQPEERQERPVSSPNSWEGAERPTDSHHHFLMCRERLAGTAGLAGRAASAPGPCLRGA